MKILVTGATGFIGYEVARQLSAAGLRPRLMVRRPERAPLLRPLDAEIVAGDLLSRPSLDRAVAGADAVIHLAARAAFESYRRVRPTIVDGSVSLLRAAARAAVPHFVHASSLLVYGNQSNAIDEQTPLAPAVAYGRAKVEAEQALSEIAASAGVRLARIRLPHVYGARDLLFRKIQTGLLTLVGSGENLYSHLHVADAARALITVARQGWTGATPIADDRPTTWNEFIRTLHHHHPRFRTLRIPGSVARLGTFLLQPALALRSRPSLYTPDTIISWGLNLPVRASLLWDEIGLRPSYPTIDTGLPAALDERVAFRWTHPHADPLPY